MSWPCELNSLLCESYLESLFFTRAPCRRDKQWVMARTVDLRSGLFCGLADDGHPLMTGAEWPVGRRPAGLVAFDGFDMPPHSMTNTTAGQLCTLPSLDDAITPRQPALTGRAAAGTRRSPVAGS